MPVKVIEERKYQRYAHTKDERNVLENKGFRTVVSSNVSAIGKSGDNLIVRFHGGATYAYIDKANLLERMWASPSKGRFVWNVLRKSGVSYIKLGNVELEGDIEDKDLMLPLAVEPGGTIDKMLLAAFNLSTMIDGAVLNKMGLIANLALAKNINAGIGR